MTRTTIAAAAVCAAALLPATASANTNATCTPSGDVEVTLHGFTPGRTIGIQIRVGGARVATTFVGPTGSVTLPGPWTAPWQGTVTWWGKSGPVVAPIGGPACTVPVESTGGTRPVTTEPAEVSPPAPASPPTPTVVVTTPPAPTPAPRPRCIRVPGGTWTSRRVPKGRTVCPAVPRRPAACRRTGQVVTWTHRRVLWRIVCPPRTRLIPVTG